MYDSTNPFDIPADAPAVAGYVDGIYAWPASGWARFPAAVKIRIAVSAATDAGDALDVEWGDAAPAQAPGWVVRRRIAGVLRPWVYCNRSNRSAVEFNLTKFGITADQVALWVATLDGTQTVTPGPFPVAAVQYANSTLAGGHYDLSLVNQTFGPRGGDMTPQQETQLLFDINVIKLAVTGGYFVAPDGTDKPVALWAAIQARFAAIDQAVARLQPAGGSVDLTPLTDAIAALRADLHNLTMKAA